MYAINAKRNRLLNKVKKNSFKMVQFILHWNSPFIKKLFVVLQHIIINYKSNKKNIFKTVHRHIKISFNINMDWNGVLKIEVY
jgi:hypothetical protein